MKTITIGKNIIGTYIRNINGFQIAVPLNEIGELMISQDNINLKDNVIIYDGFIGSGLQKVIDSGNEERITNYLIQEQEKIHTYCLLYIVNDNKLNSFTKIYTSILIDLSTKYCIPLSVIWKKNISKENIELLFPPEHLHPIEIQYKKHHLNNPQIPNINNLNLNELIYDNNLIKSNEFSEIYQERLEYELSVIKERKMENFILFVYEISKYLKLNNILYMLKGTATASLVCYLLKISNIDPIQNGLLFERFLNQTFISKPDVGFDIQKSKRDDVIRYIVSLVGMDHFAQLTSYHKTGMKRHPHSFIITDSPVENYGNIVEKLSTHFVVDITKENASTVGFAKIDISNSKILDQMSKALFDIQYKTGEILSLNEAFKHSSYKTLSNGNTDGIYQLGSDLAKQLLNINSPDNISGILKVLALIKPINADFRNANFEKPPNFDFLYDIFHETDNIGLFQEQYMKIATDICKFTLSDYYQIKDHKNLDTYKFKFINAMKKHLSLNQIQVLWKRLSSQDIEVSKAQVISFLPLILLQSYIKQFYPEIFDYRFIKKA